MQEEKIANKIAGVNQCCGNICDSRCLLKCFPVCPPVEKLLRKQNLLPEKQKCFLRNSETFDVSLYVSHSCNCFLVFAHSWKHGETLAGNNVSATMFPSLPRALGLDELRILTSCKLKIRGTFKQEYTLKFCQLSCLNSSNLEFTRY